MPLYVAAVTSRTVELASELADGIMPFLWSADRVKQAKAWIERGRAKASGLGKLDVTVGLPTFVGDDVKAMRETARQNLGLYTTFPFFQRLFRASGFAAEAAEMEKGAGGAALSDRLLDAVCLLGPMARCREQLAAFRSAGVDLPILVPPIGVDAARAVISGFRRSRPPRCTPGCAEGERSACPSAMHERACHEGAVTAAIRSSNFAVEQTAGSHSLAAAAHRGVGRTGTTRGA